MKVSVAERRWDSPTTRYLAGRIDDIAGGRSLSILDLGCGDGRIIGQLLDLGHDLSGCDLEERLPALREKLGPRLGDSFGERIRVVSDEEKIPFAGGSFDIVYANQVIEHVGQLASMFAECARVLRPGGVLLVTFPPLSAPVEPHLGIPFAHWLPAGAFRRAWLRIFYGTGLRPRLEDCSAAETAYYQDRYLAGSTSYRTVGRTLALAAEHFGGVAAETGDLVAARLDMTEGRTGGLPLPRRLLCSRAVSWLVSRLVVAAFSFREPVRRVSP